MWHGLGPGLPGWVSSAAWAWLGCGMRLGLCILSEASVLLAHSPQVSQHLRKPTQATLVSVQGVVVKCCPARGCLGDRILQVDPKCSGEGAYLFASEDFWNPRLNKLLI